MATFDLSNKVNIVNPSANVDAKYGPWASLSEAKTNVVLAVREKGLTVGIIENEAVVEYWWKAGTADGDLVLKTGDNHTHANKTTLDKIGESEGSPTWNGGAWPGGGGAAPTADNVNTALQGFTEGTPQDSDFLVFIGKIKITLANFKTLLATAFVNTFAAKTHGHTKSEISDFPTIPAAYSHPTDDGNKHVPATGTNNSGKVLTAGATAGAMTWETPASVTPADNSITNAKLSKTIVAGRIKGSKTSGDGSIEDLTPAEALELIGAKPATYNGEYAEVIHELPQNITTNQIITLKKNSINVITDFGGSFTLGTAAARQITLALPADTAGFEQYIVYMKIGDTNTVTVVQPSPDIYMTGSLIFQTNTTYKLIYDRFKTGTSTTAVALSFSKVS